MWMSVRDDPDRLGLAQTFKAIAEHAILNVRPVGRRRTSVPADPACSGCLLRR